METSSAIRKVIYEPREKNSINYVMDAFHESRPSHVIVPKVCSRKNVLIYVHSPAMQGTVMYV